MTLPRQAHGVQIAFAYASTDIRVLWRMRTPAAFMVAVPAVLAVTLGPAITGTNAADADGRAVLGIAIMFNFMTVNYAGLAFFREFNDNTWTRQSVSKPPRLAFVLGKLMAPAAAGLVALVLFGTVAFLPLGMPLHGSVAQLLVLAVALVCVGCAIGGLLFTVTSTTSTFQGLAYVVLITTGCVGGSLVPADHLPAVSRAIGAVTPQRWALDALAETTSGSGSWGPTLRATGLMFGLTAVLGAALLVRLDYAKEKSSL